MITIYLLVNSSMWLTYATIAGKITKYLFVNSSIISFNFMFIRSRCTLLCCICKSIICICLSILVNSCASLIAGLITGFAARVAEFTKPDRHGQIVRIHSLNEFMICNLLSKCKVKSQVVICLSKNGYGIFYYLKTLRY